MMNGRKVVGFVSIHNPHTDRMAWSGTLYKMAEATEKAGYDILWIKVHPNIILSFLIKGILFILRLANNWYWMLTKYYGILCARSVNVDDIAKCDYLLFSDRPQMILYIYNRVKRITGSCPPIIHYADTTFRLMIDYYWFNVPNWIRLQADALEKGAIDCCSLIIKSSDWAINSVINDYACPPNKTKVIELGANIDEKDVIVAEPYSGGELKILFSGVEWERKGGDIAVEAVRLLNEHGVKAKLYLIGLDKEKIPLTYQNLNYVEYVGFLDKNNPGQYKRYLDVICKCHCLLLPTHAECAGVVFNEAAAFGLPSFTYDTGGIANYVVNGETGYRLDIHSSAQDFANIIEGVVRKNEFEKLQKGALLLYKERNNWNTWSQKFSELMDCVNR